MNEQVRQILERRLATAKEYLRTHSLEDSIEERHQDMVSGGVCTLDEAGGPPIMWTGEMLAAYRDEQLAIAKRPDVKKGLQKVVRKFEALQPEKIVKRYTDSLVKVFSSLTLTDKQAPTQAIFLEYDSAPEAHGWGFGPQEFPILAEPDYVELTDSDFTLETSDSIDYTSVLAPLYSEEYDEIFWEFEGEPHYFEALRNLYLSLNYLCLHKAFESPEVQSALRNISIAQPLFIYGNEHDSPATNIYILE